jgi:hypothetical protein
VAIRAGVIGVALGFGILVSEASTSGQGYPWSTRSRPDTPVDGVLTGNDGRPLVGVHVDGSLQLRCCPSKVESADSDAAGYFRLEHPGTVLHFYREDLRPQTLVLTAADSMVRLVLEPSADNLRAVACEKATQRGEKLDGFHIHFAVSDSSMRIRRGTFDVDYVLHLIQSKNGTSSLELWFGPYAMSGVPDDDTFIDSSGFRQRHIQTASGETIGLDSWGTSKSGRRWRKMSIVGEGSIYRDATPEDAAAFDRIVNSVCTTGL